MSQYLVEVPTANYWRRQVKCQAACPVSTDARGYVRAVADGNEELAYLIARGPNPLASICGRVCGAPCEAACRRGDYDQAISIRALKRYVCEGFGPESRADGGKGLIDYVRRAAGQYLSQHLSQRCQDREELLPLLQSLTEGRIPPAEDKSVGIIGSGPAGLAAAHDLALLGFSVTVYEMEPVLGGMLAVGIPKYRLPRELIQAEVETIVELGVEPVTNCCVGRDVSLPELRERHDAVIIAVGAKRSRKAPYPGSDAKGVIGGVEFLREVALGKAPPLGRRVVVVGGGDAAMDSARTALRVATLEDDDAPEQGEHYLAVDTARTASRIGVGGREINIVYRRSRAEMPAVDSEIYEADEEGVRFHLLTNPVSIEKDARGGVRGIRCQKMKLGDADASGRRQPVPIEGSEHFIECDNVLIAIGQDFDLSFVDPKRDGLRLNQWGSIECHPRAGTTAADDVFVAGDLAHGAKLLIHAVASGKAVARTVYQKLTGHEITAGDTELHFPLPGYEREPGYEKRRRLDPRTMSLDERFAEAHRPVELPFTTPQARCEAGRCFDCGVNTIFDGARCVLCGGCVDVCPENCLRIVCLDQIAGEGNLQQVLSAQLGAHPAAAASAIIKDETICIRCALCAERCPTGAITMEQLSFEEKPRCRTE